MILIAARLQITRARSQSVVPVGVVGESGYLGPPLGVMNSLGLSGTGQKVAGDVHGVGPLGIPQALGFPSSSHISQAVACYCGTVNVTLTLISRGRGSCDSPIEQLPASIWCLSTHFFLAYTWGGEKRPGEGKTATGTVSGAGEVSVCWLEGTRCRKVFWGYVAEPSLLPAPCLLPVCLWTRLSFVRLGSSVILTRERDLELCNPCLSILITSLISLQESNFTVVISLWNPTLS